MAAELGMELIPAHKVREMGFDALIKEILNRVGDTPCFLTFDIDFVDPAYAPGTGTPEVEMCIRDSVRYSPQFNS